MQIVRRDSSAAPEFNKNPLRYEYYLLIASQPTTVRPIFDAELQSHAHYTDGQK
jgi:hypothetical protein